MTREELLVTVLTLTAGQHLDAALDAAAAVLLAWLAVAAVVAALTWAASR